MPERIIPDGMRNAQQRPDTVCLKALERVKGIEPSYAAWEAAVLPLNYTRKAIGLDHTAQRQCLIPTLSHRRNRPLSGRRFPDSS